MPMPLKYKKTDQKHRIATAEPDPTAKNRMRAWRKKRHDAEKEAERRFNRLYRFMWMSDYELAKAAWKAAMVEVHPDHGGDAESAARINAAWDDYKQRNGWV